MNAKFLLGLKTGEVLDASLLLGNARPLPVNTDVLEASLLSLLPGSTLGSVDDAILLPGSTFGGVEFFSHRASHIAVC